MGRVHLALILMLASCGSGGLSRSDGGTGGAPSAGSGGATASGGATGSGGATASGGATGSGGSSDGRFTLTGHNGAGSQSIDLGTGLIADLPVPAPLWEGDFYLSLRMVVLLAGQAAQPEFCFKGQGFSQVGEIPTDASACAPSYFGFDWAFAAYLGGNGAHATSMFSGDGYLVRDRRAERMYRLLIVEDIIDETGGVRVTFDVSRVN